jgi:hypothetical protein
MPSFELLSSLVRPERDVVPEARLGHVMRAVRGWLLDVLEGSGAADLRSVCCCLLRRHSPIDAVAASVFPC